MNVVEFCSNLINFESVTPNDNGTLDYIENFLSNLGFKTKILVFESNDKKNVVKNLFAEYGSSSKRILGFLGHSDVVPPGDNWGSNPFVATQRDDYLIGRGVADMKGGIAAFCCAVEQFLKSNGGTSAAIQIFISGDEEIGSYEGTRSLIKWCKENGKIPNDCLIGEPTSSSIIGDRVYLGHRGSMNINVKSVGKQGHIAYVDNYKNSLAAVCRYITSLMNHDWIYTDKRFPKTNIEPTMLFTNNYAENIAPDTTSARLNIRYGADYQSVELKKFFLDEALGQDIEVEFSVSGDSYYCDGGELKNILSDAIFDVAAINPEFSAGGGISDGRYMIEHCNIIEFGLQDAFIHQKNEKVKISDLKILEKMYLSFIRRYFQRYA
jgi:succinyl-diaminopimelate desuccinylase